MKIAIFLHGTIIMHKTAAEASRDERVQQSLRRDPAVLDYISYVPIGNAVGKLNMWSAQGAEIIYLSSNTSLKNITKDKLVLEKYHFPMGDILYRRNGENYSSLAEKLKPEVLIEDDCESIGGSQEMTITFINLDIREYIKSIIVKEFGGIDCLPDDIDDLMQV